jgi:hypothetical protein
MNKLLVWVVAAATAVGGTITPVSAQAIRAATVSPPSVDAPLIQVRDRYYRHGHRSHRGDWVGKKSRGGRHSYNHRRYRHGHYRGHRHYYYRHGHRYYYNDGYYGGAAIVGLAAGAIIAGAASTNYNTWVARCEARYRSFDRRSGTYLGYDGYRHPCRL